MVIIFFAYSPQVEGFFQQRLVESKTEDNSLFSAHLQEIPALSDLFNEQALHELLAIVQKLLQQFTNEKIKMIYLLKDNQKYVHKRVFFIFGNCMKGSRAASMF